jgi:TetR/AcrR family transcriptional repressor of uid operon
MPFNQTEPTPDRRCQILDAALVCFGKRGFHQASMHDISAEAGISVGLIYRYFENKEAVISAMADRHKKEILELIERARQAPTLLESLEIIFTANCCENSPKVVSAFVVDLYAEAARNPQIANLVRDVL